jgi:molybdopterin synthase sulfur carrier subunit
MRVRIRLFGGPREALGMAELDRDIEAGLTVGQLVADLAEEYPPLDGYAGVIRIAVNRRYADLSTELREGDEIACIPPVGGGQEW